jgi:hypothetical protein
MVFGRISLPSMLSVWRQSAQYQERKLFESCSDMQDFW